MLDAVKVSVELSREGTDFVAQILVAAIKKKKKSVVLNGGGGVPDFFMLSVSFQVGSFIAA